MAACSFVALRETHCHRVNCAHGVVDQQGQRDDESSQGNPLQIDADEFHDRKHDRKRQWDRERNDGTGPDAEADDAHRHDDGDRLPQRLHELADGTLDDRRLIGHQRRLDADRQIGGEFVHSPLNAPAEVRMSPPSRMAMARPMAGFPLTRKIGCGGSTKIRLTSAMSPNRSRRPFAMLMAKMSNSDLKAPETRSGLFIARLQGAGGSDRVLRLQRRNQGGAINPQPRELLGGELDDDLFVLGADDLDLGDVGHTQEPRTDAFHIVAKLTVSKTVRGEAQMIPNVSPNSSLKPGPTTPGG